MWVGRAVDTKLDRTGPDRTRRGGDTYSEPREGTCGLDKRMTPTRIEPNRTGPDHTEPDRKKNIQIGGAVSARSIRIGPNRSDPDRTGPNRPGTSRTEWGEDVKPSRRTGNEQENVMDSMPYRIGLGHMRLKSTELHRDEGRRGMFISDDARWTIIESEYELGWGGIPNPHGETTTGTWTPRAA